MELRVWTKVGWDGDMGTSGWGHGDIGMGWGYKDIWTGWGRDGDMGTSPHAHSRLISPHQATMAHKEHKDPELEPEEMQNTSSFFTGLDGDENPDEEPSR